MKRLACIGLAGALVALTALPVMAKPLHLDANALRQLAFQTVQAGYAKDALNMTDALLSVDPKDATALIIRSQALRALGRLDEAQATARLALTAAQSDQGRYGASMAMAQALSSAGRRTAAQMWLRRAAEYAPSERAYEIARRDFGYVRSRNPWSLDITAKAAPGSNVNNGSRRDYMTMPGLPIQFEIAPEGQALSGFEFGLGVTATYRFAPRTADRQTEARFGFSGQAVALSAAAMAAAPQAQASDYSYVALDAGFSHKRSLDAAGVNTLRLSGSLGHNWYGGDDLSDYLRLSMGVDHKLARGSLSFGVSADRTTRLDSPLQSSDRMAVSLGYGVALGADRLTVKVEAAETASASDEVRSHETSLSLGWRKGAPVAGIGLSAGLELSQQAYATSRYAEGGRADLTLQANLSMTFVTVEYMGFSPVLNLQASRNQSNSALHDRDSIGVSIGIKSSF
jgi:tetratricopeptide (TPR) repeat protein